MVDLNGSFGRFFCMRIRHHTLDFPITLRRELKYIEVSSPDFHFSFVEALPSRGQINPKYVSKIAELIAKAWLKNQEQLKRLENAGRKLPEPSKVSEIYKDKKKSPAYISVPKAAKMLKISEMSVRRACDSGLLRCHYTAGGHRKILRKDIEGYEPRRQKGRPANHVNTETTPVKD